jgi:multimeric flavodoxin WrbA
VNRRSFIGAAAAAAAASMAAAAAKAAEDRPAGSVKILGIAGSMRKGKTTSQAVQLALESAQAVSPAISVELIELAGMNLDPYIAATKTKSIEKEDDFPSLRAKLVDPSVAGVILGSPVYMGIVSSPMKALIERLLDFRQNKFPLAGKVGGAVAVGGGRNTGVEMILQQLCMFMLSQSMVVVGDGPPTSHWGGALWNHFGDDISKDVDGLPTVKGVGKRVAETALIVAPRK